MVGGVKLPFRNIQVLGITAHFNAVKGEWRYPKHHHDAFEFLYLLEVSAKISVRGKTELLSAGDGILFGRTKPTISKGGTRGTSRFISTWTTCRSGICSASAKTAGGIRLSLPPQQAIQALDGHVAQTYRKRNAGAGTLLGNASAPKRDSGRGEKQP